jgi:hypothetical protein
MAACWLVARACTAVSPAPSVRRSSSSSTGTQPYSRPPAASPQSRVVHWDSARSGRAKLWRSLAVAPPGCRAVARKVSTRPSGRAASRAWTSSGWEPRSQAAASKKCTPWATGMPPLASRSQNQWSGPSCSSPARSSRATCRGGPSTACRAGRPGRTGGCGAARCPRPAGARPGRRPRPARRWRPPGWSPGRLAEHVAAAAQGGQVSSAWLPGGWRWPPARPAGRSAAARARRRPRWRAAARASARSGRGRPRPPAAAPGARRPPPAACPEPAGPDQPQPSSPRALPGGQRAWARPGAGGPGAGGPLGQSVPVSLRGSARSSFHRQLPAGRGDVA